ncbi:hypothetical protein [Algoriphagus sediminis]|uniref:Flagellar protein FlbD n=1 Tax=Algoriphagus sediminis TaxID=3057113 RepID=A0ABT7YFK7_9BACT|nr:hypothetical protein [Algoriphagus sediminis]MDN3205272.1 hypothetical protein [Algoriphagus sediminis]
MSFITLTIEKRDFRVGDVRTQITLNSDFIISIKELGDEVTRISLSNRTEINVIESISEINDKLKGNKVRTRRRPPRDIQG